MPYVEHKFGKTFYTAKGRKSSKLPLVFLHGGPGGYHKKDSPLFQMADDRKVFLYDQIGGGRSTPIKKSQMKIETFVKELEILLKHWGIDEFHLAGGSWGTTLALEYYLRKKGKGVRSLVFQSPMFSAKDWENDANRLIKAMSAEDQKVFRYCHEIGAMDAKVYQEASARYYDRHVLRNKERFKDIDKNKLKNDHGNEVYNTMWGPTEFKPTGTLLTYDRTKELKEIAVPSLFICGQYDEATPETAARYVKKMKDSSLIVVPNASHSIAKEKPAALVKHMRKFISAHD